MNIKKFKRIIIDVIYRLLPKKYILFESIPDYTDNTYAVYSYIKENNLLPKYKLIWLDRKFYQTKFFQKYF